MTFGDLPPSTENAPPVVSLLNAPIPSLTSLIIFDQPLIFLIASDKMEIFILCILRLRS